MKHSDRIFSVIAILAIVVLFSLPPYSVLFDTTILHPPASYADQMTHLGAEERRQFRYGNSYIFFMRVKQALEQGHIQDPVILMPPQKYLNEMGITGVNMVEPSEFYYYTGIRALWANSPGVGLAQWTFAAKKPEVVLQQIRSNEELSQMIKLYKPYIRQ